MTASDSPNPRQRLVSTAYDLFTRRGVSDVGVDEVVEKADVAKTTLYRHFASKEDLVLAFLLERERLWTGEVIDRLPRQRSKDPEGQLLAIFDVLEDWFNRRSDFEACSFIKVLLEVGPEGRIGQACIAHLDRIREILCGRAELAGLRDPEGFAWSLNTLIKGSIMCAAEGDPAPARRAKIMARWLLDYHREPESGT